MAFVDTWIYLVISLAVLGLGVVSGLLVRGSTKQRSLKTPTQRSLPSDGAAAPGDTALLERPPAAEDSSDQPLTQPSDTTLLDRPEPMASRLVRLRQRLSRSQGTMGRSLLALLSRDTLDEATWEEIEDTLLSADIGVGPTQELVARLRTRMRVEGAQAANIHTVLSEELLALVDPGMDRSLATVAPAPGVPAVVMVVGVNGTGKTTTVGKLARTLVAEEKSVVLGAADTFRAAAAEQLTTWGDRVGVQTVRGAEGSDPASVAFESVRVGAEANLDVVLIDTAGRLQNKAGLMDELGKVKRVVEKRAPVAETLLVIDATTGQNGLIQARVFSEAVAITGIVLTKLDGSAKGGIVVAVQRELNVPVKLVGLGEGPDDLAVFDPQGFVAALLDHA